MNYVIVVLFVRYKFSYRVFMAVMWLLQLTMLFTVSLYGEELTSDLAPILKSMWQSKFRWTVVFNMYTLRMIAFNMDMYEAFNDGPAQQERAARKHDTNCVECAQMRDANHGEGTSVTRCYRFRTESSCHPREYNVLSYIAYILYVPLYVAGPMSSFNAFVSYCHHATVAMSRRHMLFYALRALNLYVALVFMLHFVFVNAFRLYPEVFFQLSIGEQAFLLYYSLAFLWLKFSLIWKLNRLTALLDGFDVPEDMRRCFTNTVSIRDFWRDWHASFNLWIVRYMYIPMGGNKRKHLNIFPIFFFIAIWHDIELHLLKWAMCVLIMFVLELCVGFIWSLPYFARLRCSRYRRLIRSFGGLFTVFGLIVANLIGFSSQAPTSNGRPMDQVISEGLLMVSPIFVVTLLLFLYCAAALGIMNRDMEAAEVRRLKKAHKLFGDA
ncbi:glycerol uptake protein [Trypanosoma rangeli]|uniref:Glycerol uptake protein n=1 Tax=Trypanosoma rangeli TaxID=5698 RepID=A0A3R7NNW7_TRYRA|nr:glycerol uptake protein [Trypanosoma rangeli]RNF09177.1 glycerol uptake protein [Trypanosoma rangeli]|eukprot:RNF09177.1 glycerol uptake protein [Trypanosoma rangeli]